MTLWAIVPVKPLRRGKSRLAGALTVDQRVELNRKLLAHTVDTLISVPEIEQVLVVSRDPEALSLSRDHGARTLRETGTQHLNIALLRATEAASAQGASGVLIMPADLPKITPIDIQVMVSEAQYPPVVVLAPDHNFKGTNAILISPPGIIEYSFGEDSFQRHTALAEEYGAKVKVCELPSLAFDVDVPADLALLDSNPEKWGLNGNGDGSGEKQKELSLEEYYENLD
ncbi:MAG: 2-phospho-L-lactate guanylyltransferase [Anaerolineae bacterium]|nr:2-phospho-L-lactate guanylyltransferase [Anaerolineae bacterium]